MDTTTDFSGWSDSISLRLDYSVPVLVKTRNGKMMARGYELKRFVLAHRMGAEDYRDWYGTSQQLLDMFREGFEKKLQEKYADWPVRFKGYSILQHPAAETPKMDDPRWV